MAAALGGGCSEPLARLDANPCRPPSEEVAAGCAPWGTAEARVAPLWADLEPVPLPLVEDTAAHPRAPLNAADEDASCDP